MSHLSCTDRVIGAIVRFVVSRQRRNRPGRGGPWRPSSGRRLLGPTLLLAALLAGFSPSLAASSPSTTGCGQPRANGADASESLNFGGLSRPYVVHVPSGYNPSTPTMLILNLPALGTTIANEALVTGTSWLADQQGFLVVYPSGTTGKNGKDLGWNTSFPSDPPNWRDNWRGVDDVGFLNALMAHLQQELCVDPNRIAITGYSFGGEMAFHMACAGVPWLSVIAPVAASMPQAVSECQFSHPISLIDFHGENDWVDSYYGWLLMPTVPSTVSDYAQAMGCPAQPHTGFQQADVVQTVYAPCRNPNVDVQLYSVTDGGHTWPGGLPVFWFGPTTYAINATQLMAAFLAAHPLQGAS